MRRQPWIAIAALAAAAALGVPSADAVTAEFTFAEASVSTVVSVSPDVLFVADGAGSGTYYLFTTGMGIGLYSSRDGESWVSVAGAVTPRGPYSDPSVVAMPDGSYRMYLAERVGGTQPCSGKQLRYATSADLVTWSLQPGVLLSDLGCGVPDVVRDGTTYHLYYVRGGAGVLHGIYMATSADGLAWTPNPGILTPEDRVDPSVVKIADGSWLMVTSDMPSGKSPGPFFQKLYVATSADGRIWEFVGEPVYAPPGVNAFDPNLNVMPDGTLKVWYARGASVDTAIVALGTLVQNTPVPLAAPGRPTVTFAGSKVTVAWTYPAGGASPDAFRVEVKRGTSWATIKQASASGRSVSTTRAALGARPGAKVTVRVVAIRGDESAVSVVAVARVPR